MSKTKARAHLEAGQVARKLRRNPHVGAVLHAPHQLAEEKNEGESKAKRARAFGSEFSELSSSSRVISRNPFIGSRHSVQAIHYSSNNLNSPKQSPNASRTKHSLPVQHPAPQRSSGSGIFVPLSGTAAHAAATRTATAQPHTETVRQRSSPCLIVDERRCPVLVDLPGLSARHAGLPGSRRSADPTQAPHSAMTVSLPESLLSTSLSGDLRSRVPRERSHSASTAASALSVDSAPSAMHASNASSVGDDSTAVRQLQARWARVDGGFAFTPALRGAALRTVPEGSPEMRATAAPHTPTQGTVSHTVRIGHSDDSSAFGIQLRPLELSTAWAASGRGRGDTADSRDMDVQSPGAGPDAYAAEAFDTLSPLPAALPDVVHLPRQNDVSVDLKAPLLDKSVLAYNRGALADEYDVGRAVGDGGYAVVKSATHRSSGRRRAVKFIRKRLLFTPEERGSVKREVEIHAAITHPNVVRMVQAFEDPTYAMLVVEWMPGGSLKRHLDRRALKLVPEVQVRIVVRQLLQALNYIHKHKVVHCDVKPENILLGVGVPESLGTEPAGASGAAAGAQAGAVTSIAPHTIVKLCDFGNARRSRDARYFKATGSVGLVPFSAMHGTMGYMAPEVLAQRHYSTPVDMWALGVLTYTMLSGTAPFKPYHSCQAKNAQFEGATWRRLSLEARDFCRCLLQRQPSKRATAEKALQHPWLSAELE